MQRTNTKNANDRTRRVAAVFLLCLILPALPSNVYALPMPDALGEWRASPEHVTELKDLGQWLSRIYTRETPIASVEVHLMEGSGPGTLFVPQGEVAGNDAPIGFSSTYETLNVAGHRAILERGEITGQALAISLGKDRTLTLETKSLSRKEFLDFAEKLAAILEGE